METATVEPKAPDKYEQAEQERTKYVNEILSSTADKKVVVAGPGTGKTFLFKKVLNSKTNTLTLSFVNSLVDDLSLELYGISEVRTLHSFGRSELSKILKKDVNIYSKLSAIIREDFKILVGGDIEFDLLFNERDDNNENLKFYETRRHFYDYYGFTDVIHAAVKAFEADKINVPIYEQVLIDEFQDFNKLEVSLIDLLAEKSPILLAGDDDQALYEFLKNASAHHIRLRHGDEMPEYVAFDLPYCARCPEIVVEATNDLINNAKQNGFLKERINKPYFYLPNKDKDKISSQFPSIGYANKFAKQVPWFIEKCIGETANVIKNKFDVLIITSNNNQVRAIAKSLIGKGFRNLDYPKKQKDREVNFLDAFDILIKNKEDNLGWRIIASLLLTAEDLNALIKKSTGDLSKKLFEILPSDFTKGVIKTAKAVKYILKKKPVSPDLLAATFKQFGINPDKISSDYLCEEFYALNPPSGNPALRNIPIKVTTIQSSKGLAADLVFIANFDDRYFLKDGENITDQDICNFIVALTRTKKKAFLISTVNNATPSLLKWMSKGKIQFIK
ncbi:MAG: ATP-dependent helicase [Bacteroidetes bacterium]|nr:ATP-dependent helicase [Bacteroidota bacterium]